MKHLYPLLLLTYLIVACQSKKDAASENQRPDSTADTSDRNVPDPAAANTPQESPDNFVIIPGQQVGAVRANSTEASLIDLLGAANVVRDTVYMGEGEFEIGTTIFKNTADQAQILWKNKKAFTQPELVYIRPAYDETDQPRPGTAGREIQWRVAAGDDNSLKIGSSLREVEAINGKPFKLYGFGWDYGGTIAGWEGGKLQAADKKSYLSLAFGFDAAFYETENKLYDSILGDSEFLSSNAAMQSLNPTVKTFIVSF